MPSILLTGTSGFIGPPVARRLGAAGHELTAGGRTPPPAEAAVDRWIRIPTQDAETDWRAALSGTEVVVHLAGHAHASSRSPAARRLIQTVNVEGTERLAREAAAMGVRRFIFLSSIKVHGEESGPQPFRSRDTLRPEDPYGESKAMAEARLHKIGSTSSMQVVIIRPPLVIGARSKANLARLEQLVSSGLPLPFASIRNTRSLLSLDNLADLIAICVDHPRATEAPLLAADAAAPSTPELIRWIASALHRPARLFRCPPALLEAVARPLGLGDLMLRLTRSLAVDASTTTALTGWVPTRSTLDTLRVALQDSRAA
jgi:nucleoside-diphosphate-sugar epimerase